MVKIRLLRVGKRRQPHFRVVVADSRSPRDGRIIEAIGHYHPRSEPSVVEVDNERALYWLRQGAQASDQVRQILRISGAWSEFTGEAPISGPPPAKVKKPTPAASVAESEAAEEEASEDTAAPEAAAEAEAESPAEPEAVAETEAETAATEEETTEAGAAATEEEEEEKEG